jgi:hypothetical protein
MLADTLTAHALAVLSGSPVASRCSQDSLKKIERSTVCGTKKRKFLRFNLNLLFAFETGVRRCGEFPNTAIQYLAQRVTPLVMLFRS